MVSIAVKPDILGLSRNDTFWLSQIYRLLPDRPVTREAYRDYLLSLQPPARTIDALYVIDQDIRSSGWGLAGYLAGYGGETLAIVEAELTRCGASRHLELIREVILNHQAWLRVCAHETAVESKRLMLLPLTEPHALAWLASPRLSPMVACYAHLHIDELQLQLHHSPMAAF